MTSLPAPSRAHVQAPPEATAGFVATQRVRLAGLRDLPARTALRVSNMPTVARALGRRYAAALTRHRPSLPSLTGIDAAVVTSLRHDGVFVTSLAALRVPGSTQMTRLAGGMADAFANEARARVRAGSDFNLVPAPAMVAEPAVYRWGLDARLLAIAEAYLALPPAYDGASINYTVADGREVSTRKWHRDWEDRRMLKIAVYLNDVDVDGGPFQMIRRTDADQDDSTGYRYGLRSDGELATMFGTSFADDVVSCEGKTGTVVFTDTARFFHRGKPATARDRKAVFFSYFSRRPRHPFFCERSGLSRDDSRVLADGLDPAQRAAVLWREGLALPMRLIPPARL